jgi:GxxExxY protein
MPEKVLWDRELSPELNALTHNVISACIAVHKALGPGLLESVYEACVARELALNDVQFQRQVPLALDYRGLRLESGYVIDLVVDDKVIVELKAVELLQPIHEAQLMTYLKLTSFPVGLLINFNVTRLVNGVKRFANTINTSAKPQSISAKSAALR